LTGAVIAIETDTTAAGFDVEGELGPVIVSLRRRCYRWIGKVPPGDSPEGVSDESPSAGELSLIVEVLELAAATLIMDVMGTTRLDPMGGALEHTLEASPGEPPMLPNSGQLDEVSWRGTGHEDRFTVGHPGDTVAPGGQAEDANRCHRSASLRACLAHSPPEAASGLTTERRL